MKKLVTIIWAFLIVFLVACQPTPDREYIVNRADGVIEQRLSATGSPKVVNSIPNHWTEAKVHLNARVSVIFDATIVQKEENIYPVYRTRSAKISPKETTQWITKILPQPITATTLRMTKTDWTRVFQSYVDDVNRQLAWSDTGKSHREDQDESVPTQEEIDAQCEFFRQQIYNAPEENEIIEVNDYQNIPKTEQRYQLSDGNVAYVLADEEEVIVGKGCHFPPYNYYDYFFEREKIEGGNTFTKLWNEVTLSQEEAEVILKKELEQLGFTGYSIVTACPANLMETDENTEYVGFVTKGWVFQLRRDWGGYPQVAVPYRPSAFLQYGAGDGYAVSPSVQDERLELLVNENGIQSFLYSWKKEIVGIENIDVTLLPFEEAIIRIKNALAMCYPSSDILHVYELVLTTHTVKIKNSDDFYEIPCWVVFFKSINNNTEDNNQEWYDQMRETLIINAVDGSVVHEDT